MVWGDPARVAPASLVARSAPGGGAVAGAIGAGGRAPAPRLVCGP
jgi:hypothetical protein